MEGLEGLVNLEELWLGKNKIEQIQGLEMLTKLRRLDVQSNRLTTIENLTTQRATLEELYLSHNAVTTEGASIATGLAQDFPNLTTLDLSRNRLTTTKPFGHLLGLDELWLSGNKIASFEDVKPIANLPSLDTIYLEYNPLQEDPLYRKRLAEMIPCLKQIDANMIGGYVVPGIPSATPRIAETDEERLRRLQDMAVTRAEAETRGESPSK
jgi:protein phosphatase 1 regulatory subunit 7